MPVPETQDETRATFETIRWHDDPEAAVSKTAPAGSNSSHAEPRT
jgi:hypothetical protein